MSDQIPLAERTDREGSGEARFEHLSMKLGQGQTEADQLWSGCPVSFDLSYAVYSEVKDPVFYLGIYDLFGEQLLHMNTQLSRLKLDVLRHSGTISCAIPRLPLPPGQYWITVALTEGHARHIDRVPHALMLTVESGDFFSEGDDGLGRYGKVLVDHDWEFPDAGQAEWFPEGS
jgi:lipopolysaccharide transport system ATP-binding protein